MAQRFIPAKDALEMATDQLPDTGGFKTEWEVPNPLCDFCVQENRGQPNRAHYDGKTTLGPWACMCDEHFASHGVALGTGAGQRLTNTYEVPA